MVNDIDFTNNKLHINKNLIIKDGESEIKCSPKTDSGFREIPIPNKLLTLLKEYVLQLDSLYLFTQTKTSKLMTRSSFTRFWNTILDKINIAAGGTRYKRKDLSKKNN